MPHAYTAGMPTDRRRRRRALLLALVAVLILTAVVGAIVLTRPSDAPSAGPPTPQVCASPPAGITVNVLNATSRTGVAGIAADALRAQRFEIGTVGNAPQGSSVGGVAELRHGPAGSEGAAVLARYIRGAVLVEDDRTDTTVDALIGEGFGAVTPSPGPC